MGEAKNRGSKVERTNGAVEHKEAIDDAIESRTHTKGLVWLIFETTSSTPVTDMKGAFVVGEDNKMVYGPNEESWKQLRPEDVPEWLKQDLLIHELMQGVQVCSMPDAGGQWFRGVVCSAPDAKEVH